MVDFIFPPHADFDRLSIAELGKALADADERLTRWHEAYPQKNRDLDTRLTEKWLIQERRRILAELARRNGNARKYDDAGSGERTAITRRVSEIQREEVSWLWENRIPRGKLTIVEGDPGLGKSWLTLAVAAAVTRGWAHWRLQSV
jgi:DNA replication protein DnaC